MSGRFAGKTLAGRYDVLELLGAGGMGDVYRARDRELDELIALKVIRDDLAGDPVIVARFRHEVKLARRVTHKHVARTFELGSADGVLFYTMELVEGESLTRYLAGKTLPIAEATSIAAAICDGLAAAHTAGVIHRDVKPDNVLIASDGRVVVADFGVAAISVAGGGELSGTPAYMAPEQARGDAPSPAADVYSVGVMLYEMLTGRRGFIGAVDRVLADKQVVPRLAVPADVEVPAELAELIGRATDRELSSRIATAGELRQALAVWAHPGRARTSQPRSHGQDVRTIIIVAPRAGSEAANMPIAGAIHEELLRRLSRMPRVRIQPRHEAQPGADATTVVLIARDTLEVTATAPGDAAPLLTLHLPLAVARITAGSDLAAHVISDVLGLADAAVEPATPAREAAIGARYLIRQGSASLREVVETLERAHALAPDDPSIAANLARTLATRAFVSLEQAHVLLSRARELSRRALAAGPDLAETHVAAGHVELQDGIAAVAASHFRVAIACSPYSPEGHEWMGRMLLEAGYLDDAIERLDHALAITPDLPSARWEMARALALDGRWDEHDRMVAPMIPTNDRILARARYAWWRGDRAQVKAIGAEMRKVPLERQFEPLVVEGFLAMMDDEWLQHRDHLIAQAVGLKTPSLRRRVFTAQLIAESAGVHGDVPTCTRMIEFATDNGLFDLHWLDRCPVLEPARAAGTLAAARVRIHERAEAILDALYGDHVLRAMGDTVAASR